MIVFNVISWFAIYKGYSFGIKSNSVVEKKSKTSFTSPVHGGFWIFLALGSLAYLYPLLLIRFHTDSLSLDYIIARTALGHADLSEAYMSLEENDMQMNSIFSSLPMLYSFIFGPFNYLYKYVSIYYWKELNFFHKFVLVVIIGVDILAYIAIGTNKGIFDYVLTIPLIIYISRRNSDAGKIKMKKKYYLYSLVMLIAAIWFFSLTYTARTQNRQYKYNNVADVPVNDDNIILQILPEYLEDTYMGLDFYVSHAYDGLDRAMGMNFIPCYGLGNSPQLCVYLSKFGLGKNVEKKRYETRIARQRGVDVGLYWDTAYVAFANDVSFFFVPIVLFLLSIFYGRIWRYINSYKDYAAIPVFAMLTIEMFYLNANNQILGKIQLFPFVVLAISWWYRWKIRSVKYK